jgi:hypothetical protein
MSSIITDKRLDGKPPKPKPSALKRGLGSLHKQAGNLSTFWSRVKKRIYSQQVYIGMKKELEDATYQPPCKFEFDLRLASQKYILEALYRAEKEREKSVSALIAQRWYRQPRFHRCYTALASDTKDLCSMQWLVLPQDIRSLSPEIQKQFAPLKDNECLLESSYVFDKYRDHGIMPWVIRKLGDTARTVGFKRMVTYVPLTDISSLGDCHKAGFQDFEKRIETKFLFRTLVETMRLKPSGPQGGMQRVIRGNS